VALGREPESQGILAERQHAARDDHGGESATMPSAHRTIAAGGGRQDGCRGRDEERVADEHDDEDRRG